MKEKHNFLLYLSYTQIPIRSSTKNTEKRTSSSGKIPRSYQRGTLVQNGKSKFHFKNNHTGKKMIGIAADGIRKKWHWGEKNDFEIVIFEERFRNRSSKITISKSFF